MPRGKISSFHSALLFVYVKRGTGTDIEGATLVLLCLSLGLCFICETVAYEVRGHKLYSITHSMYPVRACARVCVCMSGFCNVCVCEGFVMCGCFW
jgi:hypothetical protein